MPTDMGCTPTRSGNLGATHQETRTFVRVTLHMVSRQGLEP